MSKKHPTPWKFDIDDADEPIKDANGERIFTTDDGFLGPDDDTIREIVEAVNERDRLRDALNEVCRRASVALNCPRYETEAIDLLVHDLLGIKECARAAIGEDKP